MFMRLLKKFLDFALGSKPAPVPEPPETESASDLRRIAAKMRACADRLDGYADKLNPNLESLLCDAWDGPDRLNSKDMKHFNRIMLHLRETSAMKEAAIGRPQALLVPSLDKIKSANIPELPP
jgi:hypothetical protein